MSRASLRYHTRIVRIMESEHEPIVTWPIRFVSFVALVAVVAVVALCYPLHQREKFLGDTSHSRTGLLFMRQVALPSLRFPSKRSLSNSAPFCNQSIGDSSLLHGLTHTMRFSVRIRRVIS